MDEPITILRVSEETGLSATGRVETKVRVEFKVGEHGPFNEHIPKAEFNAAGVRAKLEDFRRTLAGLIG